jgi:3-dehydroquinate synthetase
LAFGGGVIGNIVGLAAALLFRGIRFVEIPTTFLAQTDSTLSNKQAVNSTLGKNHFGVYYAPIFIWADTKLPHSEKPVNIRSGLVESVKNGLISDSHFLDYLERKLSNKGIFSQEDLHELIYKSILSKIQIIRKDPSEKKYGVILEYGHTIGHAIEKLSHGSLTHGEAVAIGMIIEGHLSYSLGYMKKDPLEQHYHMLCDKMGLNLKIPSHIETKDILEVIDCDNKKCLDGVNYVLLEDIGKVVNSNGNYMVHVDSESVMDVLKDYKGGIIGRNAF